MWNGLALVRPKSDPDFEPAVQWVSASVADATIGEATGGLGDPDPHARPRPWSSPSPTSWADQPVRHATVPVGATTAALPLTVADDAVDEDDEVLALSIVSISRGVRLDRGTASVTVVDDDAAPLVSAGDRTVAEGDTSLTDVAVPVRLDAVSGKDVEVLWTARDGAEQRRPRRVRPRARPGGRARGRRARAGGRRHHARSRPRTVVGRARASP